MTEPTLEQAMSALKDQFGNELREGRERGRDAMVKVLEDRLHLHKEAAKKLVEALEEARSLRWVAGPGKATPVPPLGLSTSGGAVLPPGQTGTGTIGVPMETGYWQL